MRPSGTEPVIRVMAEGDDRDLVETLVAQVCNALKTPPKRPEIFDKSVQNGGEGDFAAVFVFTRVLVR